MEKKMMDRKNLVQVKALFVFLNQILGKKLSVWLKLMFISQIILALCDLFFMTAFYPVIRNFTIHQDFSHHFFWSLFGTLSNKIWFELIVLACIVAFKNGASIALQLISNSKFSARAATIETALFEASLEEDMEKRNNRETVDMVMTVGNLTNEVFGFLISALPTFCGDLFTLFVILGTLIYFMPALSFSLVVFLFISGYLLSLIFGNWQRRASLTLYAERRNLDRVKIESTKIAPFLMLSHQVGNTSLEVWKRSVKTRTLFGATNIVGGAPRFALEVIVLLGMGAVLIFIPLEKENQLASIGLLIAGIFRALPVLSSFINNTTNIKKGLVSLEKFEIFYSSLGSPIFGGLIDYDRASDNSAFGKVQFSGDLVLDQVEFKYVGSQVSIFKGLNTVFKEKTTTLVRGPSGAGKTTLLYLISGLLSPSSGEVRVVGKQGAVRMSRQISGLSFVEQNVPVFNATIAQNICGGSFETLDEIRLMQAIQNSGLTSKIDSNSLGIHQLVGEDGNLLSAGERQRLGLARALYAEPRFLILDEPTANLDISMEVDIWEAIRKLRGKITIVLVSHRPVPVEVFDSELVLPAIKAEI